MTEDQLRNEAVEALTESEVKRLETLVQAEVEKEQKDDLRKKYKERFRRQMRQRTGAEEGVEEIYIDLAKHSDGIVIDGVKYQHGHTYTVKSSLATEMRWIMQSTYWHQAEVDGKRKGYYTERNTRLSPGGVVNTTPLMRV
jgi:uncharacterized Zn finger protein